MGAQERIVGNRRQLCPGKSVRCLLSPDLSECHGRLLGHMVVFHSEGDAGLPGTGGPAAVYDGCKGLQERRLGYFGFVRLRQAERRGGGASWKPVSAGAGG